MHSKNCAQNVHAITVFHLLSGKIPFVLLLSLIVYTGILECQVLDVGVAAFLLDPDDLPSSYPHLLARFSIPVPGKVCKEKYMQLLTQP